MLPTDLINADKLRYLDLKGSIIISSLIVIYR
jgi:hypothetical protein